MLILTHYDNVNSFSHFDAFHFLSDNTGMRYELQKHFILIIDIISLNVTLYLNSQNKTMIMSPHFRIITKKKKKITYRDLAVTAVPRVIDATLPVNPARATEQGRSTRNATASAFARSVVYNRARGRRLMD